MSVLIKGKIIKRKKQKADFTAENIDNMASVNKILDDLQDKNNQAYTFYCQTLRQRKSVKDNNYHFHYTLSGHPLNAFPTDWDGDLNSGYFEVLPYKSLMPRFITKIHNVDEKDPVAEWMTLKKDWLWGCYTYRLAATSANMMKKYVSLNDEVMECPKHFVDLAVHLDSDPDPFFNGSYNWYYAGNGNLQLICIDGVDYLLHSVFSTLCLTQFFKSKLMIPNIEHEAIFECEGNNILETICSSQNIIALRTQKKIYILKIETICDKLVLEKIKAMESELPFTGISFDKFHKNILYITSLENKLTIVNLDRLKGRTVKLKNKIDSLVNNWSTVISSHRACYIHVVKNTITTYDKRTNTPSLTWNSLRDITDDLSCNDITSAKQIEGSACLYVGTDHHLFLIDLRFHQKSKHKAVQRWTHGMQCVPTYMSTCNFECNKELVCLNSQWCEDTCIVVNYADNARGPEIRSVTMPYRPPSILSTLNEARQNLLCFNLHNPIDGRLCTSITGSVIVENGDNYNILMQNSLGDILCHTLYPEHMEPFVDEDGPSLLHEWSKSYQKDRKIFEVSSIEDFSSVWKKLRIIPSTHILGKRKVMSAESNKFNEKEVFNSFEKEEIDSGLLDVWVNDPNETLIDETNLTQEQSSLALNLHYTDDSE